MDKDGNAVVPTLEDDSIRSRIFTIRGVQVMLDHDLAELYGVAVKYLNRQVKRNIERFPDDFMFQLNRNECSRCQFVTLNEGRGNNIKYLIDRTMLIHVGASFNYLGKKCFAFSSMDKTNIPDILAKI